MERRQQQQILKLIRARNPGRKSCCAAYGALVSYHCTATDVMTNLGVLLQGSPELLLLLLPAASCR